MLSSAMKGACSGAPAAKMAAKVKHHYLLEVNCKSREKHAVIGLIGFTKHQT